MTLTANIRRAGVLLFALLLFVAAIGPSCLMSAAPAMAVPMHAEMPDPSDCGSNQGDSVSDCPHDDSKQVVYDLSHFENVFFSVALAFEAPLPIVSVGRLLAVADSEPLPPPSHQVPLRV